LEWIANANKKYKVKELFDALLSDLLQAIKNNESFISSFADYKDFIITKSKEKITFLFKNFYNLLQERDKQTWLKFDQVLKNRVCFWLFKKGITKNDVIESLYQEAQSIFVQNMANGKLVFEDSRFLKSYIFKIINLKLFDYYREAKNNQSIEPIEKVMGYSDNYNQCILDLDKTTIKEKLLGNLNKLETKILTDVFFNDEKLKDIAKKLDISEANCRVIKHRALAKLEKPAKQLGYF
jgi:RNA polymerase sigma factor (sigma-70 family)